MSTECTICARGCKVLDGRLGACGNYFNDSGLIREMHPHRYLLVEPIAIESVPIFNFYPSTRFLQITTTGCVFNCSGCVSGVLVKEMNPGGPALVEISPEQIANKAMASDCAGVAFLMNDPLASFHTFAAVAREAHGKGLLVGFSSNGYFSEESLNEIIDDIDFANIGLKGFTDDVYRTCGVSSAAPVYRTLRRLHERGVHVEVSCIFKNDNREEILAAGRAVAEIGRSIPFQVMRFVPYEEAPCNMEPAIRQAEEIVREMSAWLDYVYLFNSPGTDCQDTLCPECGLELVKREYWGPMGAIVRSKKLPDEGPMDCPHCGTPIALKGCFNNCDCDTSDGGYSYTRALEIIEGILITMGVDNHNQVKRLWEETLGGRSLYGLHMDIQHSESYLERIRTFGVQVGEEDKAEGMIAYYRGKLEKVAALLRQSTDRPRVYYCMGKPLYAIKPDRFENHIVELSGGISVNQSMSDVSGRPGMKITAERLNQLNPDIIFLSAQYEGAISDFYLDCQEAGVEVAALQSGRVYNQMAHGWEYGSPRWLLGFLHMANCLHPDICSFNMESEASEFYERFYGISYDPRELNHSFSRPSSTWEWIDGKQL